MQKFEAIKTESGKWVMWNVESGEYCEAGTPKPFSPGIDLKSVEYDVLERCCLVDVIVLEKSEIPGKSDLLAADLFMSMAFDRDVPGHEKYEEALLAVKKLIVKLAEVV